MQECCKTVARKEPDEAKTIIAAKFEDFEWVDMQYIKFISADNEENRG